MSWNIIVDSSSDLTKTNFSCKNSLLDIVPLKILVGDKEFVDSENVNVLELLAAMKLEKKASSSACPSPEDFVDCFKKADFSVCFTMTGALSGTNNCAQVAKSMMLETNPEKKIHIVDSHATAGVIVLLAKKADELIAQGLGFEEIATALDEYNTKINLVFALGGYDNLIKTGRMKPIVGAIATHLGIRAVAVNTPQGEIDVVKKPRGEEKAISAIVDIMNATKDMTDKPVIISHCRNLTGAKNLKALIEQKCKTGDITILECKALTSFYTMETGIIVGY